MYKKRRISGRESAVFYLHKTERKGNNYTYIKKYYKNMYKQREKVYNKKRSDYHSPEPHGKQAGIICKKGKTVYSILG